MYNSFIKNSMLVKISNPKIQVYSAEVVFFMFECTSMLSINNFDRMKLNCFFNCFNMNKGFVKKA